MAHLSRPVMEFANNNAEFLQMWYRRQPGTSDKSMPGTEILIARFADAMASPNVGTRHQTPDVTNENYAAGSQAFREACELAGVKPTARQASRFRRKMGIAYKTHKQLI